MKIKYFAYFFISIIAVIVVMAMGCNPAKVAARKDNAAIQRVLGNYSLQQPIINSYLQSHPQITDTIQGPSILLPGKTFTKTFYIQSYKALDTTLGPMHLQVDSLGRILLSIKTSKPDTILKPAYIHDLSGQQRALDSAQFYRLLSQGYNSQFQVATGQLSQIKVDNIASISKVTHEKNIYLTVLIAMAVIAVAWGGFKIYGLVTTGGATSLFKKL